MRFMSITTLIRSVTTSDNIREIERTSRIQVLSFYMLVMAIINVLNSLTAIGTKIELFF